MGHKREIFSRDFSAFLDIDQFAIQLFLLVNSIPSLTRLNSVNYFVFINCPPHYVNKQYKEMSILIDIRPRMKIMGEPMKEMVMKRVIYRLIVFIVERAC